MSSLVVREVNDVDQLQAVRSQWQQLLYQTEGATFFQSLEWLTAYWRHFDKGQQLRVFLVEQQGALTGIVPLVMKRGRFGMRVVEYPLDSWGTSFGPLGPATQPVLGAALAQLQRRGNWDLLDLRWTSEAQRGPVAGALNGAGMPHSCVRTDARSCIDLPGNWDDFWLSLSSKVRNNLRRGERKLADLGAVSSIHHRCIAPQSRPVPQPAGDAEQQRESGPRWELYQMCEQVAGLSWQASSTTGNTLTHARVRSFLREVHELAAGRGCVSMHLLRLGEQPIAYAYNYVLQGRAFGLRAGYDPQFAAAGPGSVLLAQVLQDGIRHGDSAFDLGEGTSAYKQRWRNRTEDTYRFRAYRSTSVVAQMSRLKQRLEIDPLPAR